ncbi:MAG: hypothetical protein QMB16_00985 [Paracoccaceae bacterium]|jgi:pimeloyl-ACP methyl ester carboxylesterase
MTQREIIISGGHAVSVLVAGRSDEPTILLSNLLGAGLGIWAEQRAMLEPRSQVICYDTRGHGQSSTLPGNYTVIPDCAHIASYNQSWVCDEVLKKFLEL